MSKYKGYKSHLPLCQIPITETDDLKTLLPLIRWREENSILKKAKFMSGEAFFCASDVFAVEGIECRFDFPYRVVGFIPDKQLYVLQKVLRKSHKPPDVLQTQT